MHRAARGGARSRAWHLLDGARSADGLVPGATVRISRASAFAELDSVQPSAIAEDWGGAGCHANEMRRAHSGPVHIIGSSVVSCWRMALHSRQHRR